MTSHYIIQSENPQGGWLDRGPSGPIVYGTLLEAEEKVSSLTGQGYWNPLRIVRVDETRTILA